MRHRPRSRPLHPVAAADRARAAFVAMLGEGAALERQRAIDALPVVEWRGQRLYTLRCHGPYGRGPHGHHVPPHVLWMLIDLRWFACAFHTR